MRRTRGSIVNSDGVGRHPGRKPRRRGNILPRAVTIWRAKVAGQQQRGTGKRRLEEIGRDRSMSGYRPARSFKPVDAAYRLAYRIGFPLAVAWWHLRRPRHEGAIVAVYVGAALLLVRSSYRTAWNFPGGGIRRGETPDVAARRELAEEIGVVATHIHPWGWSVGSGMARTTTCMSSNCG